MTLQTRAALQSSINTDIADNAAGDISAADVRTNLIDMTDSAIFPEDAASVVNVSSISDFPTPVADKITLASDVVYHIHGAVDLGVNTLVVPTTGASIAALNGARDVSSLISSEDSYTMFESPSGSYSGNVVLGDLTITVSGVGSKVFDLDNDENSNALDIVNLNFISCTSLGNLDNYRQLFFDNIGFIFISDGLTFNGTWSGGLTATNSIAIGFPAATLFKEGTSLTFGGSVKSNINFLSVDAASVFMDFDEANILSDQGLLLTSFRTIADDAMPNLPSSNVKVKYLDCVGLKDTYVGGEYTISTSATTTISTVDTLVKMAGTTTYSDMQWFTQSTDNAFVYNSNQSIDIKVDGSLSFTGGNGDEMGVQIRQWDDSASAYVNIGPRYVQTFNGAGKVSSLAFMARTTIDENDRIEIWIENQSDTSDITAELGGFVGISER